MSVAWRKADGDRTGLSLFSVAGGGFNRCPPGRAWQYRLKPASATKNVLKHVSTLYSDRRSRYLHAVGPKEPLHLRLRRGRAQLGKLVKEGLHGAGGLKGNEQSALIIADVRPDVRNAARRQHRIAGRQGKVSSPISTTNSPSTA